MDLDVLVFTIGPQRFGIALASLIEVTRAVEVTPLPSAPPVVEGVVNVRGTVVPILDLRRRFGRPPNEPHPDQHLVIARAGQRSVAFRVDQALEIAHLAHDAVTRMEDVLQGTVHLAGVAKTPDGLVLIHDTAAFLSQAESERIDEALAAITAPLVSSS